MLSTQNPLDVYARAVMRGSVLAGKYHQLSCARHLRDRQREDTKGFPYRFDLPRAERFFRFAQRLKHYKGEWAGHFIVLQPFQVFRLGSIFGWVHVETGLRRFRTAYNEIPRKNGKSLEAAVVAIYVSFFDGEAGAEGYCIATKREQAKVVFNDCKRLVKRSGLRTRIDGWDHKHGSLHRDDTESKLEPLGADSDSTDGLNPNLIINDEFHAQKNREMLDVMETATGAREQPLNYQITTAGDDLMTPCGDQHDYAVKILEGVVTDPASDTFFAFIAHADPEDDWTLERTARKANPNWGISVKPDDLRALVTKAIHMPAASAAYKQKRLNLWVNANAPWLSLDGWRKGQTHWTAASMAGERCWAGIDLSSKIDLTAVVLVFPPTPTRATWRWLATCVTPEDTLVERARRDRAPYPLWVKAGLLKTNPGNRIDQSVVRTIIQEAAQVYDLQQIGIDPWNAGNLVKELGELDGFQVVEIPQTLQQMSAPSKDFEADVLDGLVDGGDNPLLLWCISNVVVQRDGKDNIYPVKKKSKGRIDPVIAGLMGRKLAAIDPPAPLAFQVLVLGGAR